MLVAKGHLLSGKNRKRYKHGFTGDIARFRGVMCLEVCSFLRSSTDPFAPTSETGSEGAKARTEVPIRSLSDSVKQQAQRSGGRRK